MEILLLHPGGLGDSILSLPSIALLRKQYPSARITLAANLDHLAPVPGDLVDRTISLATLPLYNFYSDAPLSRSDRDFWRSFDRIISWTGAGDPDFVRRVKSVHPDAHVASWKPAPGEKRHVSRLFVDSIGIAFNAEDSPLFVRISINPELARQAVRWLSSHGWNGSDRLMALHPGAGSNSKRWPLARFKDLAIKLGVCQGYKLLVVEGPAESGLAGKLSQEFPRSAVITAASLKLDLLAAVMSVSKLFVGNDSGIAHLAAALGVPSIVLFGPTLPSHWAPLGPHVAVLRNPHGCNACAAGGGAHSCLENITVDEVIRFCEKYSNATGSGEKA